jgi:putative glutamine amidotransferase
VINVALGGTHVADLQPGCVSHLSPEVEPSDGAPDHLVSFEKGSIAADLFGASTTTNSWHHQAVDECGAGLVVTGRARDGVIEAVELPGAAVLGVQWHPEWMTSSEPTLAWVVRAAERVLAGPERAALQGVAQ